MPVKTKTQMLKYSPITYNLLELGLISDADTFEFLL